MNFTINDVSNFLNVDRGFVRRVFETNEFIPTKKESKEFVYSFYQIVLIKPFLEQLLQNEIIIDIKKQEVFSVFESKMNNYE